MEQSESRRCIIRGKVPSKSNCYRVVRHGSAAGLAKSKALIRYEEAFFNQCSLRGWDLRARFRLDIDVYYENDLPDLDNSLKVVLDCLQHKAVAAIHNDRYCVEIYARRFIDKKDPRVELTITPVISHAAAIKEAIEEGGCE